MAVRSTGHTWAVAIFFVLALLSGFAIYTRGTVAKRWAWTHHPAWYRRATGRDPRADYQAALEREAVPGSRA